MYQLVLDLGAEVRLKSLDYDEISKYQPSPDFDLKDSL